MQHSGGHGPHPRPHPRLEGERPAGAPGEEAPGSAREVPGPSWEAPGPAGAESARHVLVVDDDPTVAEVVAGYLDRAGYRVDRAADGPAALALAAARRPDLVVLDLMLPGLDGLEVCRRLRAEAPAPGAVPLPVIMLTARGDEDDRILGLEVGADDYVTKPFSPRELVLRVESVLRRSRAARPAPGAAPLAAGPLRVDPAARRALKNGAELALTVREFDLLTFFLRHPGRVFGREELMREVWGWDFGDLSTVTVHVRRLRAKIEDDPAQPRFVQTVWGVGYRLGGGSGGPGIVDPGIAGPGTADPGTTGPRTPGPSSADPGPADRRTPDARAPDFRAPDVRTPGSRTPTPVPPPAPPEV